MNRLLFALVLVGLPAARLAAQDCGNTSGAPCGAGFVGPVTAECVGHNGYPSHLASKVYAHRDRFHPAPHYAYSRAGIDATRMNTWNQQQAATYPWHGDYSYWRWGVPTALVVPPTAAFQSEYNWGVAQTKSLPIYHQFGRTYAGLGNPSGYPQHPYWPSSTNQFGIYPVRAPH